MEPAEGLFSVVQTPGLIMDQIQLILATVLLGLVVLVVVWYVILMTGRKALVSRPTYLILGITNLGKTLLFARWNDVASDNAGERWEEPIVTVSLMEANYGQIRLPFSKPSIQKLFQLIDYPGHLKYFDLLQKLILNEITLQRVKGVVFVVDSSQFKDSSHTVAKYLFNLLSVTERLHNGVDFLFAVNKTDLFDSTPVVRVRQMLEDDINSLIQNELTAIDKNNLDDNDDPVGTETLREFWLSVVGSKAGKFTFDKLEGNMDFVPGLVVKGKLEMWENWLDERVVN